MPQEIPTPEELDKLSNKILRVKRCKTCGETITGGFTGLVQHLQDAHGKD